MPQTIHTLLIQYLSEIQKIYGAHLKSVILYGSYARGDYTPDSDIDIMILVDLSVEEMDAYFRWSDPFGLFPPIKVRVLHRAWPVHCKHTHNQGVFFPHYCPCLDKTDAQYLC